MTGELEDAATHRTLTAADGSFSLPDVPAGQAQVVAAAPGYQRIEGTVMAPAHGQVHLKLTASLAPSSGEVVVTGKYRGRPAAVLALQAPNTVSVLTAKELTYTPDENIASSLSRLPGVTALPGGFPNTNGVGADLAGRGEANFTSLRGLDAEFNINTVNGVDAAQGLPYSRAVQLALLPPVGLQTVVVNKSLTPATDGDAIGGIIDYRTPNAYDFAGRTAFSMEGGAEASGRAIDYGKQPLGGHLALSGAEKFGDHDQFGVYLAGYYAVRSFDNTIIDGIYPAQTNGEYAFTRQSASGASSPRVPDLSSNLTLTGLDVGATTGQEERWGATFSADWRPSDGFSAYTRVTYAHQSVAQESYYSQIYGNKVGAQPISGSPGEFQPLIGYVQPRFYYETNPEEAVLSTYQVGAEARLGRLHLSPNLFASYGYNDDPDHFEFSARQPEVAPGYAYGQSMLFRYGRDAPQTLLPASELATLANIPAYGARRAGELTTEFANQLKLGGRIDAVYDVGSSWLQNLQFGAKFENSSRNHTVRDYTTNKLFTTDANDPAFGSLPVFDGSIRSIAPGYYDFRIPQISLKKAFALFYSHINSDFGGVLANASDQCGATTNDSLNCDTQHGIEQVSSAYAMADLKLYGVEVMPGLRFEHTDIRNTFFVLPADDGPADPGHFASNATVYNKVLPSVSANWRPNGLSVYRAAVWTSYVRPSLFQLGGSEQISPPGDSGVTTITEGNPNLKTLDAINYDVSAEWLDEHGGSASAAFFDKEIHHFIFSQVNAFTNAAAISAGQGVVLNTPTNGGSGHVYGLELAGRRKLVDAPAPFDGFGVAGNLTLEHSGVHTGIAGLDATERLINQPDLSGNAQLFYEKGPFDAELSYRYVGPYVAQYGTTLVTSSRLDDWVQENHRIDLHVGYLTPWRVHLDASVGNLFDTNTFNETVGRHSEVIPTYVYSGRNYYVSAKYAF